MAYLCEIDDPSPRAHSPSRVARDSAFRKTACGSCSPVGLVTTAQGCRPAHLMACHVARRACSEMTELILKRAASRPSGQWSEDDCDVLAAGVVVGRIFKANAAPVGRPWMRTLGFGYSATTRIAHRPMAMRPLARPQWPPSPKPGGASPISCVKAHWRNYAGICTATSTEIMQVGLTPSPCRMEGAGDAKAGRHSRK